MSDPTKIINITYILDSCSTEGSLFKEQLDKADYYNHIIIKHWFLKPWIISLQHKLVKSSKILTYWD